MKKVIVTVIFVLTLITSMTSCNKTVYVNSTYTSAPARIKTTKEIQSETEYITTYYNVTEDEREILARLVFLESSICSAECQQAVVSVVFNRLECGKWGNTIEDVVYYPNAFTPSDKIHASSANKSAYEAVDYVIKHGSTLPTQVRYFRTDHDFNWKGYENYCVLDNVYFGYFTDWKQGAW